MLRQVIKLPIKGKTYQNVDERELSTMSPYLINGRVDEAGVASRSPGTLAWIDLGTSDPVDGLHWDDVFSCLWAISDGKLFKIVDTAGTNTDVSSGGVALGTNTRTNFANNGTHAVFANGGRMVYAANTGVTAYVGDADAPTTVTSVDFINQYILCNETGTGQFHYSALNDVTSWDALDFATAETLPDVVNVLKVVNDEILLGGPQSIEHWWNDGTTPFSRKDGGYISRGVLAPNSIIEADNTVFFFDQDHKVTRLDVRTPKVISVPYDKTIGQLESGTSVIGNHLTVGGLSYYILHFPSDARTFAYDYMLDDWAEWASWNSTTAVYEDFPCRTFAYCKDFGFWVAGSRTDGKIYKIGRDYHDLAGGVLRFERRTGHVDHGTLGLKRSNSLALTLNRGTGISGSTVEPMLMVKYRDDNDPQWSNEYHLSLGLMGNRTIRVDLKSLGMYYTRQWSFAVSSAVPVSLIDAEEHVDFL